MSSSQGNDADRQSQDNRSIGKTEYEELLRLKFTNEIKSEILYWARRRASLLIIAISVLGFFGVSVVINESVRSIVDAKITPEIDRAHDQAIDPARRAAVRAEVQAEQASNALASLRDARESLERQLKKLNEKAENLDKRFAEYEADINNIRTLARRTQTQLEERISALDAGESSAAAEVSEKNRSFEKNSEYKVLVFYRDNQDALAKRLTDHLLQLGYRSSRTATDLLEARRDFPPGHIQVMFNDRGARIKDEIRKVISNLADGVDIKVNDEPAALKNGDMQLLLF